MEINFFGVELHAQSNKNERGKFLGAHGGNSKVEKFRIFTPEGVSRNFRRKFEKATEAFDAKIRKK